MKVLDIIILTIIAIMAVIGIYKGFIRQIVSILALILGVWCASHFTDMVSEKAASLLSLDIAKQTLRIIVFAIIFLVTLLVANLIGKGIEKIIQLSLLGWLNRLMGFLLGAFKGIIILGLAVYAVQYLNSFAEIVPKEVLEDSKGFEFLENFTQNFFPYLKKLFH